MPRVSVSQRRANSGVASGLSLDLVLSGDEDSSDDDVAAARARILEGVGGGARLCVPYFAPPRQLLSSPTINPPCIVSDRSLVLFARS
eukprot:6183780-Pleurochrysis_carterae.AAC.3